MQVRRGKLIPLTFSSARQPKIIPTCSKLLPVRRIQPFLNANVFSAEPCLISQRRFKSSKKKKKTQEFLKTVSLSGEKLMILFLFHKSESQKTILLSSDVISGDLICSFHLAQILLFFLCQVVDGSLWCEKKIKETLNR